MTEVQMILIVVWDTIVMMGFDTYLLTAMVIALAFFVIRLMMGAK